MKFEDFAAFGLSEHRRDVLRERAKNNMTLRDKFAVEAMRAIIGTGVDIYMVKTTAALAYEQADAMLEVRAQEEGR